MKRATFRVLPYHFNILNVRADVHVCPVNCQPGVMGKGLAKTFADEFQGLRLRHERLCRERLLRPGKPSLLHGVMRSRISDFDKPITWDEKPARYNVLLFPTKDEWREPGRIEWIWQGLGDVLAIMSRCDLTFPNSVNGSTFHIVFPALGCGLGGLCFGDVRQIIKTWATCLDERFEITLIEPRPGDAKCSESQPSHG